MENSPVPAPAAPAAPAEPVAQVAPATEPAQAPKTIDPVDHSAPTDAPAAPTEPAVAPAPTTTTPDTDAPVTAATLAGEAPEPDETTKAIQSKVEAGEDLPTGINPDGTLDPLVYTYENMPDITVQGKEGKSGEIKTYTVKTAEDLPADFRFASQVEQTTFSAKLQQNMNVAKDLMNDAQEYNNKVTAENERLVVLKAQKTELDSLIAAGKLPAITAKPTDANFMQDKGAVRAQQVLDHMNKLNADYAERGISQKITSVEVALQLLEADEAIAARDARMGTVTDKRNEINSKISGGGSVPAGNDTGNQQFVHKDVRSAMAAGRKRMGL